MRARRLLGWLVGIPLTLVVVDFAVANRQPMVLDLWPLPWSLAVPAFLAVLGALAVGLVIGAAVAGASGLTARRRAGYEHRRAESLARQLAAAQVPPPPSAAGTPSSGP